MIKLGIDGITECLKEFQRKSLYFLKLYYILQDNRAMG